MKIKICGITNEDDAAAAVGSGADALGFIFVPDSPRYVTPERAREIIQSLPPFVTPTGVFVNAPRSRILEVIGVSGIRCVQLHGEEPPTEVIGFTLPVCKAFRASEDFRPETLAPYTVSAYLLDAFADGAYGGTGRRFDWRIAVNAKWYGRIILSGGLNPENVAEAIRRVEPYAVDVSSGVEREPGKKDHHKIRMFCDAVRMAGL